MRFSNAFAKRFLYRNLQAWNRLLSYFFRFYSWGRLLQSGIYALSSYMTYCNVGFNRPIYLKMCEKNFGEVFGGNRGDALRQWMTELENGDYPLFFFFFLFLCFYDTFINLPTNEITLS